MTCAPPQRARRCGCWPWCPRTRAASTPTRPAMVTPVRWPTGSTTGCRPPARKPLPGAGWTLQPNARWRCATVSAPTTWARIWCAGPTCWSVTSTTCLTATACSGACCRRWTGNWRCWSMRPTTWSSARAACTALSCASARCALQRRRHPARCAARWTRWCKPPRTWSTRLPRPTRCWTQRPTRLCRLCKQRLARCPSMSTSIRCTWARCSTFTSSCSGL